MRIGVYVTPKPQTAADERGRHAIAGPPEWIAERLREYVDAGCNGFVVNLGHASPDLEERVRASEPRSPRSFRIARAESTDEILTAGRSNG